MLVPLLTGALAAAAAGPLVHEEPAGPLAHELAWAAPLPAELHPSAPVEPPRWEEIPVGRSLHPVRFQYGRRYQQLVTRTMGGPRASAVFGPIVAQADVHWRLLDATGRGLPGSALSPTAWRDSAFAGSLLAGEQLLDETIEGAPVLYGVYLAVDTLLSPSFDVRRSQPKRVQVSHRSGGPTRRAVERAEEELAEPRPEPRTYPAVGAGLDWALREEDAPADSPFVRYTAWVNVSELGLTSMRFEFAPADLSWVLSGREKVIPRVYLIGSARSEDLEPVPARLSGGIMWLLPWRGNWNLRFERIVSFSADEERWLVTLRCENRTGVPAPLDPPLGDRGRPGPVLPWVPEGGPNRTTRW